MATKKINPKLSPQQLKKMHALFNKLNEAIDKGYASQALQKLAQLEKRFPQDVNIHTLTGKAEASLARHAESIAALKKAVDLRPKEPDFHYKYGVALHKGGKFEEALLEFERVIYLQPNHFYALRHKSSALTDLGRTEEGYKALIALEEAIKDEFLDDDRAMALAISRARHSPKHIKPEVAINDIKSHVEFTKETQFKKAGYFQMGRLYNLEKKYDDAFDCYTECKKTEMGEWDPDAHSARVDQLIDCWCTDQPIPFSQVDGSRLIFVLGMMRSGTSLTEQMISQVEGIIPGGEMNTVSRHLPRNEKITTKNGRRLPLNRALYTQKCIDDIARKSMRMYNEVHQTKVIIDKQPYNYSMVPLISHVFPGCKIVHCMRDGLDCCLSNFSQAFARLHMQTHDLYWLGRYYADYERIMKAWHTIDEVDMIDLPYEELVSDPETQSKRVMEFLGREWTEDILNFHKSKRTVNTASRDQVRKPMYTSSVKKYAPFEHRLGELKRGIEEGRARPHGG